MGDADKHIARTARAKPRLGRVGLIALVLLAAASALHGAGAADGTSLAQRGEPRIAVAAAILARPASQASLSIQVGPREALPGNSFIRVRGLPPSISLIEGHSIGPGSWAVPLFALPTLKANVPAGVSGRSEIIVNLVAVDGTLLAEARTALVVGPAAMLAPAGKPPEEKRASTLAPPIPMPAGRPDRNTHVPPR